MPKTRVLTGITTTGTPHLGNYVGAIRPAVAASRDPNVDAFYFLADYHALIKCDDPVRIERSRLEIAATWLAAGLDPERVTFYRQSDIPEIPELTWLLTCVTSKGLMNRAHAYKASTDANELANQDADAGVTMGLFSYPILMAADILMFNAHKVPVGRDQIQHIEMARDIGARFNHLFGNGREFFVLPEVVIEESVATLPGLDGRKMSKSYDNTIPLFDGGAKRMKETIARIVTDSKLPGEAKDPDSSALTTLYSAFASADELATFRAALVDGLGWGEAKQRLFDRIERDIAPMRERYDALIAKPADIEELLQIGAGKARAVAAPLLAQLREAVGLRSFVAEKTEEQIFDEIYKAELKKIYPRETVEAARISAPYEDHLVEGDSKFGFTVRISKKGFFESRQYSSLREAGVAAGKLKGASRNKVEIIQMSREDGGIDLRLLLDGDYIAKGGGVLHPKNQEDVEIMKEDAYEALSLMFSEMEELRLRKSQKGGSDGG